MNKMIDTKICDWLMDNADASIRYRVTRELLKDEQAAKKIELELLENTNVLKWLKNLQSEVICHGCFDNSLENAAPKLVQLGLHSGLSQIAGSLDYHINQLQSGQGWDVVISNFLALFGTENKIIDDFMLSRLDKLYDFAQKKIYDIYISAEEKAKLTGVPKRWKDKNFIKPELFKINGYCYPLIYDIIGVHRLYDINSSETNEKINIVINYISTDEFHNKIDDGYGILISGHYVSGNPQYHGMGWDPKYPGWFNVADYMENGNAPKLLFFAQNISKYPPARKTSWFNNLLTYLEKYKTENGTYLFPAKWLKESQGYAVQGHHISFGENRRKKNWSEIESTFYMQLLPQNT
jgi:hypothetical protein